MTHHSDKYTIKALQTESRIEDGVLRWNSNDRVPFDDAIRLAISLGMPVDRIKSAAVRDAENAKFIAEYKAAQAGIKASAEELAEMRANFEPGTVLVNVLTGRRTKI